jgi:hypothetical protein
VHAMLSINEFTTGLTIQMLPIQSRHWHHDRNHLAGFTPEQTHPFMAARAGPLGMLPPFPLHPYNGGTQSPFWLHHSRHLTTETDQDPSFRNCEPLQFYTECRFDDSPHRVLLLRVNE